MADGERIAYFHDGYMVHSCTVEESWLTEHGWEQLNSEPVLTHLKRIDNLPSEAEIPPCLENLDVEMLVRHTYKNEAMCLRGYVDTKIEFDLSQTNEHGLTPRSEYNAAVRRQIKLADVDVSRFISNMKVLYRYTTPKEQMKSAIE